MYSNMWGNFGRPAYCMVDQGHVKWLNGYSSCKTTHSHSKRDRKVHVGGQNLPTARSCVVTFAKESCKLFPHFLHTPRSLLLGSRYVGFGNNHKRP